MRVSRLCALSGPSALSSMSLAVLDAAASHVLAGQQELLGLLEHAEAHLGGDLPEVGDLERDYLYRGVVHSLVDLGRYLVSEGHHQDGYLLFSGIPLIPAFAMSDPPGGYSSESQSCTRLAISSGLLLA